MSDNILQKVNDVCAKSSLLPIKKLRDMAFGETHKVTKVYKVKTKFGVKTIIDCVDFSCFLPGRLNNMCDGYIEQLNLVQNLYMSYMGRDQFQANIIEFKSTSPPPPPSPPQFTYYAENSI